MSATGPQPERRPRGRPRLPDDQRTRLVTARLTGAEIAVAQTLGSGDLTAGLRAALKLASSASAASDAS